MKRKVLILLSCLSIFVLSHAYAVIPVIQIEINGIGRSDDDYIGATYIKCGLRLMNGADFKADVPVMLRNVRFSSGGQVLFSATGGTSAGTTSLTVNVKRDNRWTVFYLKSRSGFNSKIDKDAIVEVVDQRSTENATVLARKALMVGTGRPYPASKVQVQVVINSISTLDDYVTWAPTPCTIRLLNGSALKAPVTIVLHNMPGSVGKINFAGNTLVRNTTAHDTSITLTLPVSGTAVDFFIAGRFGSPSTGDKDAVIEALQGKSVVAREALMVRVRKNGNTITSLERQRFLNALATFNNTIDGYMTFHTIHSAAGKPEGHATPAFLPWHRAFILDLERELQKIDPAVTLCYWKFDAPAPNIFSKDFMGSRPLAKGDAFADFNSTNPLAAWKAAGGPGIRRISKFPDNGNPYAGTTGLRDELATLAFSSTFSSFSFEINPHSKIHTLAGGASGDWMGNITTSVKDPLFFFLHTCVDRLWAKWQWMNNRFDGTSSEAYPVQGTFPGSGTIHIGSYAQDTMWPWNEKTGTYTGVGTPPVNQRPTTAPGGPLADALSFSNAPGSAPRLFDMIDYRNNVRSAVTNPGLGFCYDDVPYN